MSGEAALDLTIGVPYSVREVIGVDGSAGDTPMASIEKITDGAPVEMGRVPVSALNGMDLSSDTEAGNYGAIVAASNGDWSTHRVTGGALGQTLGTLSSPATNPQAVGPQTADESSPSADGSDGADKAPTFDRMVVPADAKESLEDLQGGLEDQNDRNWFQNLFSSKTNFDALGDAGDGEWIPSVGSANAKETISQANSTLDGLAGSSIDADPSLVSGIGASPMANMTGARDKLTELSDRLTGHGESASGMYTNAAGVTKGELPTVLTSAAEGVSAIVPELADTATQLGDRVAQAGDARNAIASGFDSVVDQGRVMVQEHMSDLSNVRNYGAVHGTYNDTPSFDSNTMTSLTSDLSDHIDAITGQLKSEVVTPMTQLSSAAGDISMSRVPGVIDADNAYKAGPTAPPPTGPDDTGSGPSGGGNGPVRGSGGSDGPSSGGSPRGGSGKSEEEKRDAAERIADILSGGNGGSGFTGNTGGMMGAGGMPFDMSQMGQMGQSPMAGLDQMGLGTGGMTATEDPYESLLNPSTHLTNGFTPGDMGQIRQSMAPADAASSAMVRPYTQEARTADQMIVSPPAAQPGQAVPRPTALGADMRPLDRDGDGKVDDDAVAATKENMTDEEGNPKEVDSAVMIGGEPHPVTVDDPRLLEMMNIVGSDASDDSPVEILEAAESAGVPLSSYGEMLEDPTDAEAGDVVISSKGNGFYLGDGQVLMENGEVKPIADVLELRPPQSGIFSLELPELPDEAATDEQAQAAADAYATTNDDRDLVDGGASEGAPAEEVPAEDASVEDSAAGDEADDAAAPGTPDGGADGQGTAGVAAGGDSAGVSPAAPGGGTPVAEDVPLGEPAAAEEPDAEEVAASDAEEPAAEEAAASDAEETEAEEAEEPADAGTAEEPASEESPKAEAEVSVEFGRDGFHADGSGSVDLDAIGLRDFDGKAVG